MTASNLFMSWLQSSFTPDSGSAINIAETTEVKWDPSSEAEFFYGDGSLFPKAISSQRKKRDVTLTGGNCAILLSLPEGTEGTFRTTLGDYKNGVGSGALQFVLFPCIVLGRPVNGQTGKFASGDVMISGYAPDGQTDPLTVTQVP